MSTLESRHLGPITLEGGAGGGTLDAQVPFAGSVLPVRIEIDYPERFDERVLNDIDMVLDSLEFVDNLARDTIAGGLRREDSAPAQMFRAWQERQSGRDEASAEFLQTLRPTKMVILPDGGSVSRNRVSVDYSLDDGSVPGKVTVRFLEPTGPELVPAPMAGY